MNKSSKMLSDLIVYMKYARYNKELKRRESWSEIVERNKQMHVRKYPKIAEEIEEVYDSYVLPKKVLPSMRSMQFAGPAIETNNARMFNCFREDTEFVTAEGVKSFTEFDHGAEVTVLTPSGQWKKATVKRYGMGDFNKITIKRGRNTTVHYATANHRWIKSDGTTTTELQVGDYLLPAPDMFQEFKYDDATPFEKLYWAYGYVYGDGTIVNSGSNKYSMVRICGKDKERFYKRFEELGFSVSSPLSCEGDMIAYTGRYLKTAPNPEVDSPELVRAFVAGYLDADGAKNNSQTGLSKFKSIHVADKEHQETVEKLFPVAGVYISSVQDMGDKVTNLGVRNPDAKTYRIFDRVSNKTNAMFRVTGIERGGYGQTWCLEVEDEKAFVLSSGISTGNCSFLPMNHYKAFSESMFLLLGGTGVGYSVQRHHVAALPQVCGPKSRHRKHVIDDSIMGWADAVKALMKAYFFGKPDPVFDYSCIREKGTELVTAGGKAPGPGPLKECLFHLRSILDGAVGRQLSTLEVHDMVCHIADAVLAGGIRRSACISLFSVDDLDMINCKGGNWWETAPQRGRANNSAVILRHSIDKEEFFRLWGRIEASGSGEPGLYWTNDLELGTNPSMAA